MDTTEAQNLIAADELTTRSLNQENTDAQVPCGSTSLPWSQQRTGSDYAVDPALFWSRLTDIRELEDHSDESFRV